MSTEVSRATDHGRVDVWKTWPPVPDNDGTGAEKMWPPLPDGDRMRVGTARHGGWSSPDSSDISITIRLQDGDVLFLGHSGVCEMRSGKPWEGW